MVASAEDVVAHISELEGKRAVIANEVRVLDTIPLNELLGRAVGARKDAAEGVRRAEVRLGRARLAETRTKAIHDAVAALR